MRLTVAVLLGLLPSLGTAQVGSAASSTPVLSAVSSWNLPPANGPSALANSLTIVINAGAVQTISSLTDNLINTFPTPVSVTTQWQLSALISLVDLVGYFAVPSTALSTGTDHIASSRIEGRMTTGRATAFTPFTQAPVAGLGTPGGSLHLFRQLVIGPFNGVGQRTDNLDLRLDLRGLPSLAAGTYRGTLTLRAVAY